MIDALFHRVLSIGFLLGLNACSTHSDTRHFVAMPRGPSSTAVTSCTPNLERLLHAHGRNLVSTDKTEKFNANAVAYGTFAEIGAGQRVAALFFDGKQASNTIFKSVSAYGKDASSAAYGATPRFVSEERLLQQLDSEFAEIVRVNTGANASSNRRLFAFANTVTTGKGQGHGWVGLRFQPEPGAAPHDIRMHVRLKSAEVTDQQQDLGHLGVNLVTGAYNRNTKFHELVSSLKNNLSQNEIEIDVIRVSGPDFNHVPKRRLPELLINYNLSEKLLVAPNGEMLAAYEGLFKKNVIFGKSVESLGAPSEGVAKVLVESPATHLANNASAGTSLDGYYRLIASDWGTPQFEQFVNQLKLQMSEFR